MVIKMTEYEALQKRISVRSFRKLPIPPEIVAELQSCVDECNAFGLHFQLVDGSGAGTPAVKLSPGMFSGEVYTCVLLVGPSDRTGGEMVGYFSEKLILRAVSLGLGTCWVAGTFDKKSVSPDLGVDEKLWGVVPVGYATEKTPVLQRAIRSRIRARDRKLQDFVESDYPFASLPAWVRAGVEAVRLGPSAVNQQPVNIVFRDGLVTARLWKEKKNEMMYNDLGIAKYQFQVAAEALGVRGFWNFGETGEFIPE